MDRPGWDEYFMRFAQLAAARSSCVRTGGRKVGAVIVKSKQLLATGYNGAPKGMAHCIDAGCIRDKLNIPSGTRHEMCRGTHAEQNAIIQAAYQGTSIRKATLYTTLYPCTICLKMIINAGIVEVVYLEDYPDPLSKELGMEAANLNMQTGMEIRRLKNYDPSKRMFAVSGHV